MGEPVDTSAEAVLQRLRKLDKRVVSGSHYGFQQDIWQASADVIDRLQSALEAAHARADDWHQRASLMLIDLTAAQQRIAELEHQLAVRSVS